MITTTYGKILPKGSDLNRNLITSKKVCPPFSLSDEDGNQIDPLRGVSTDKPDFPKQTCRKCHGNSKITQGFQFRQGKDEQVSRTSVMVTVGH
jgi:hypothetical protein